MNLITPYMIKTWMANPVQVYQKAVRGELHTPETEMSNEQQFARLVGRLAAREDGDSLSKRYAVIDAPSRRVKAWTDQSKDAANRGLIPIMDSQLKLAQAMAASLQRSKALADVEYGNPPTTHAMIGSEGRLVAVEEQLLDKQDTQTYLAARPSVYTERGAAVTIRVVDKIDSAGIALKRAQWTLTTAAAALAAGARNSAYLTVVEQQEPHCTLTVVVNASRWEGEIHDAMVDIERLLDGGDTQVVESFRHRIIRE